MIYRKILFTLGAATVLSAAVSGCAQVNMPTASAAQMDKAAANIAVVEKLYTDVGAGDMAGFKAAFADDVVWMEAENFPQAVTNPHVGIDAVMAGVFGPLMQDWSGFVVDRQHMVADDDEVVMFGRYEGVSTATGKRMNPQAVHHWTLNDAGQIIRFQQYIDTLAVKEAMTP